MKKVLLVLLSLIVFNTTAQTTKHSKHNSTKHATNTRNTKHKNIKKTTHQLKHSNQTQINAISHSTPTTIAPPNKNREARIKG